MLCNRCGEKRTRLDFNGKSRVCKRCRRKARQIRIYGLSEEQVEILTAAGNECAICHARVDNPKALHVDHDHKTGNVRGLLCANCNSAVGMVESRYLIDLAAIIRYLEGANLNMKPHRPHEVREVREASSISDVDGQQWLF